MSAGSLGGVVGYAAVDPDFRRTLEGSIPGSSQLMELVLGEKEPASPSISSKKITSSVMITEPVVKDQLETDEIAAAETGLSKLSLRGYHC